MKYDEEFFRGSAVIDRILGLVLGTYPFLCEEERVKFDAAAKSVRREFESERLSPRAAIAAMLDSLPSNGHADIKPVKDAGLFGYHVRPDQEPSCRIESRLLIVKIPSWVTQLMGREQQLVGYCIGHRADYDGIVIDVREDSGGSSMIANAFGGIFFSEVTKYGDIVKRSPQGVLYSRAAEIRPHGTIFIDCPVAVLASEKCFSANELFIAAFKTSGRGTLFGQPTGGGSACPHEETVELEGRRWNVRIPTWRFFLNGETRPIEETKIQPDILCSADEALEVARKHLSACR